jgi:hypothetical protein
MLPSVTAILAATGLGPDLSRVPAAALEVARARGSAVHALAEADHYGYADTLEVTPVVAPYFDAYKKFVAETPHKPIISEFLVTSERWRYLGHPDRLAWMGARRVLLDWKSSDQLDLDPVTLQLCGYKLAYEEEHPKEPIHECYAVQLRSDGTYRLHPLDTSRAMGVWQAAVIVFHERARRGA